MSNLHRAHLSPRILNGVWMWYEGDTFKFNLELVLEDQDGVAVDIQPTDRVEIEFRNRLDEIVKTFEFTGVQNNIVSMTFDEECTAKFPKGKYTYDVRLSGADITTVANDNKVVVE